MSVSSSATTPGRAAMSPALVVFLLALLFGMQPLTTDLYLPALPALTASFGAPMAQAQLTLTAMLLAFGISQLVWGQLSDRFGRGGLLALAGVHAAWASFVPFLLYMLAHGIHQPCGQSSAVAPFPGAAGTASALTGFVMMVVAFAVGGWVGQRLDATVFALTNGVWFWSVCLAAISWTLMQRDGEVRRT